VQLDRSVAQLADSDTYSRTALARSIGSRLDDTDRGALVGADHSELVHLLGTAGITATTTVAVLHADGCTSDTVARLLPTIGVPMSDGIRVLHQRWDIDRVDAARMLSATGTEMRQAGCTATEILAFRPESILSQLPTEPHLWELAAGTMTVAGHPAPVVVSHLVQYASTAECFATGLATLEDAGDAIGLAARLRAQPGHIAAAADRLGLTAPDVAQILRDEHAPLTQTVAVLGHLCDFDDTSVTAAWHGITLDPTTAEVETVSPRRITSIGGTEIGTADELLAMLNRPTTVEAVPSLFEVFATPIYLAELTMEASKT
jgi:hypothetical protein